jgi:hypothetical protein
MCRQCGEPMAVLCVIDDPELPGVTDDRVIAFCAGLIDRGVRQRRWAVSECRNPACGCGCRAYTPLANAGATVAHRHGGPDR